MAPIKVLLAEDHHVVRAAFVSYLAGAPDIQVVGEVAEGGELMPAVEAAQPDVLLLDVVMPGLDAPQATRALKAAHPDLKVLVLSAHKRAAYVLGLLEAGAAGYMLKDDAPETLVAAIRAVAQGEMWQREVRREGVAAGADGGRCDGAGVDGGWPVGGGCRDTKAVDGTDSRGGGGAASSDG